jgi:energy-coupling factor transporter ATP-binding protein EcfA2
MNLKEMLNLANKIVFEKTGQHLDDLQAAVLRGTLQRETYKQIAKAFDCSESRVRNTASQLWQILSEEFGEKVSKSNIRSAMERLQNSNILNFAQNVMSGSFNFCGETRHPPNIANSHPPNQQTSNPQQTPTLHHDLSEMPELGTFYDSPRGDSFASRASSLETLKTWILQENSRLIALTGISGIGKTTLAVQLVQLLKDEFEYVIWCSLEKTPTLAELEANLIEIFSQSQKPDSTANNPKNLPLIKYLQKHRVLVVLDDIHHLFSSGELAGKYQPGYEDYRGFFKQIEKLSHQSCFLLIGWEAPREIPQGKSQNTPIRTLQLTGLDIGAARQILRDYGLAEIPNDSALINRYQGNPLWLKSVASQIQELGGCVTELLQTDTLFLPEDLKDVLQEQFIRLSEIEKNVMFLLAKESETVTVAKLLENSRIASSDLLNALQSLSRRGLIEKQANLYTISSVIKQYIKGL